MCTRACKVLSVSNWSACTHAPTHMQSSTHTYEHDTHMHAWYVCMITFYTCMNPNTNARTHAKTHNIIYDLYFMPFCTFWNISIAFLYVYAIQTHERKTHNIIYREIICFITLKNKVCHLWWLDKLYVIYISRLSALSWNIRAFLYVYAWI